MTTNRTNEVTSVCEEIAVKQSMDYLRRLTKEIQEFTAEFCEYIDEQKKQARELWTLVTRYNILNSGPPHVVVAPFIVKEEIMEDLIVKIQEKTTHLYQALLETKRKYDLLSRHKELLYSQTSCLDWNLSTKKIVSHSVLSQYLEDVADIVFQFDIAITCISQYFDSINLHDCNSYKNLMNSFSISVEITDFVKEFVINTSSMLLN